MTPNFLNKDSASYKISDDMALGFYDADGFVILQTNEIKRADGSGYIEARVAYGVNQSESKSDMAEKWAEKFEAPVIVNEKENEAEVKVNVITDAGQKIRAFLQKNPPKNPDRLMDFLLAEKLINLLGIGGTYSQANTSVVQQLAACRLISAKAVEQDQKDIVTFFQEKCKFVKATPAEIEEAKRIADPIIVEVLEKMDIYKQSLNKATFSADYIYGAAYGDGSFFIHYTWHASTQTFGFEPTFTISANKAAYCMAFDKSIRLLTKCDQGRVVDGQTRSNNKKSRVKKQYRVETTGGGAKNLKIIDYTVPYQKQYKFYGVTECYEHIIPLMDKAPWMPAYKKEQYLRWRFITILVYFQVHLNQDVLETIIDLSYQLVEKGGTRNQNMSKQDYIDRGIEWLNKTRVKPRRPKYLVKNISLEAILNGEYIKKISLEADLNGEIE